MRSMKKRVNGYFALQLSGLVNLFFRRAEILPQYWGKLIYIHLPIKKEKLCLKHKKYIFFYCPAAVSSSVSGWKQF